MRALRTSDGRAKPTLTGLGPMRAFHAEPNAIKRDEIAARQLHGLKQRYAGKLRLSDVKEMFEQMRIGRNLERLSLYRH